MAKSDKARSAIDRLDRVLKNVLDTMPADSVDEFTEALAETAENFTKLFFKYHQESTPDIKHKIKCTLCRGEIEIEDPFNDDLRQLIEDPIVCDELSRLGCACGVDRDGDEFILCENCTEKMIHE